MIDQQKIKQAVVSILEAVIEDPSSEVLSETPRRVAQMYAEFFSGLDKDPIEVLKTAFDEGNDEMVVLKDIPFFSVCEHHLLPFRGKASIGYIPTGRVVGASKLVRALDILARRPQLQERLTRQLADTIFEALVPDGVGVVLSAEHLCLSLRGVEKSGSTIVTSATRGSIKSDEKARREFYAAMREL